MFAFKPYKFTYMKKQLPPFKDLNISDMLFTFHTTPHITLGNEQCLKLLLRVLGGKIGAAASPVREPGTGGRSPPLPTGPATQPIPSILGISTAGGAAPGDAAAAGAATTSSVVRRPPRSPGYSTV
jgi:hypothetical protein